jgi:hypothetical protein
MPAPMIPNFILLPSIMRAGDQLRDGPNLSLHFSPALALAKSASEVITPAASVPRTLVR